MAWWCKVRSGEKAEFWWQEFPKIWCKKCRQELQAGAFDHENIFGKPQDKELESILPMWQIQLVSTCLPCITQVGGYYPWYSQIKPILGSNRGALPVRPSSDRTADSRGCALSAGPNSLQGAAEAPLTQVASPLQEDQYPKCGKCTKKRKRSETPWRAQWGKWYCADRCKYPSCASRACKAERPHCNEYVYHRMAEWRCRACVRELKQD